MVLDPPSFARSKKYTFSASKDYVKLLKEAIEITSKYGVIVASTNSANFSMKIFRGYIEKALKNNPKIYFSGTVWLSLITDFTH